MKMRVRMQMQTARGRKNEDAEERRLKRKGKMEKQLRRPQGNAWARMKRARPKRGQIAREAMQKKKKMSVVSWARPAAGAWSWRPRQHPVSSPFVSPAGWGHRVGAVRRGRPRVGGGADAPWRRAPGRGRRRARSAARSSTPPVSTTSPRCSPGPARAFHGTTRRAAAAGARRSSSWMDCDSRCGGERERTKREDKQRKRVQKQKEHMSGCTRFSHPTD